MPSIENRSVYVVTATTPGKDKPLVSTFAVNRKKELDAHVGALKAEGAKVAVHRTDDLYAIRVREQGHKTQTLYATSLEEAFKVKQRLELERSSGLFIDYQKARSVTLADLLIRYLREEGPRHKGFRTEGYTINAILADAGLARVNVAEAYKSHPNPHPALKKEVFPSTRGASVRTPSPTTCFILKPFAEIVPEDFNDYVDDRCASVTASTADRELDIFSAVCNMAIKTWRIAVAQNPFEGVRRPRYFNERDRRLVGDEEDRLLAAAYEEDAQKSIERRLEELMGLERQAADNAGSLRERKSIIRAARKEYIDEAEQSYVHVPWLQAFIGFQLMTGARRGETLALNWSDVSFEESSAFIRESKNGRPRNLVLRAATRELLQSLPRVTDAVFPMSIDALRKAWARICKKAGLVGKKYLLVHDLRHEAISRVADEGGKLKGGFSIVDLQAFSGHLDTRMLLRYTHLCVPALANRLDEAFSSKAPGAVHHGRRRLESKSGLTLKNVVDYSVPAENSTILASPDVFETAVASDAQAASGDAVMAAFTASPSAPLREAPTVLSSGHSEVTIKGSALEIAEQSESPDQTTESEPNHGGEAEGSKHLAAPEAPEAPEASVAPYLQTTLGEAITATLAGLVSASLANMHTASGSTLKGPTDAHGVLGTADDRGRHGEVDTERVFPTNVLPFRPRRAA